MRRERTGTSSRAVRPHREADPPGTVGATVVPAGVPVHTVLGWADAVDPGLGGGPEEVGEDSCGAVGAMEVT